MTEQIRDLVMVETARNILCAQDPELVIPYIVAPHFFNTYSCATKDVRPTETIKQALVRITGYTTLEDAYAANWELVVFRHTRLPVELNLREAKELVERVEARLANYRT